MPGPFYHVNDISVYLCRQRGWGVPNQIIEHLRLYLVVSVTTAGVLNVCEVKSILFEALSCSFWFKAKKGVYEIQSLGQGPPPLSNYVDTYVIHIIKWTRSCPLAFAYCKWLKTGHEHLWQVQADIAQTLRWTSMHLSQQSWRGSTLRVLFGFTLVCEL